MADLVPYLDLKKADLVPYLDPYLMLFRVQGIKIRDLKLNT